MAKRAPKAPVLLGIVLAAFSALAIGVTSAAALDYTFTDDMVYWSPLNATERVDVDGADNSIPPYCQINIDTSVTYMQAFCYFTNYEPIVWRENVEDEFFYVKDSLETDTCYFRFYGDGQIMLVTGCLLGGTWTHDRYWKPE